MLGSEVAMLEEMLRDIGPDRVIERIGIEQRLKARRADLAALGPEQPRLLLTFRGDPVERNRAIHAEFGGKAAALFSEALATVSASLSTQLGSAGPLPQVAERHLRIVGTAVGSFGFEMELPPPNPEQLPGLLPDMSDAVNSTLALIREASAGDEDALSEVISATHPRAAAKVQEFVRHVIDRNALFGVTFGEQRVAIHDVAEGRVVLDSLSTDQIQQDDVTAVGELIGVLPEGRRFEARRDDGEVIRGRIDRSLDAHALSLKWLRVPAALHLRETRVRSARPSYVLLEMTKAGPDA
ncbi:MAG: hypothetical protein H6719_36975 [Sandaracinaceae bacterium]|nr:hypothetical protein [Sandaracinaceae bacterium]